MTKPISIPHSKYFRHRLYSRLRHGRHMKDFLATQVTRLSSTATGKTFTVVTVANVDATGLLTITTQPADGDTATIGFKTYTFKTTLTGAANEVARGAAATNSRDNLVSAVNASAGSGTTYGTGTVANTSATAAASGANVALTSIAHGASGNSVMTTVVSTGSHISFGATTLTGGVTATYGPNLTSTAHGFKEGEGPLVATNSGGALPAGMPTAGELFVHVVDTNTIAFATSEAALAKGDYVKYTGAGTGTQTATRGTSAQGIFDLFKRNNIRTVLGASDIDNLR